MGGTHSSAAPFEDICQNCGAPLSGILWEGVVRKDADGRRYERGVCACCGSPYLYFCTHPSGTYDAEAGEFVAQCRTARPCAVVGAGRRKPFI